MKRNLTTALCAMLALAFAVSGVVFALDGGFAPAPAEKAAPATAEETAPATAAEAAPTQTTSADPSGESGANDACDPPFVKTWPNIVTAQENVEKFKERQRLAYASQQETLARYAALTAEYEALADKQSQRAKDIAEEKESVRFNNQPYFTDDYTLEGRMLHLFGQLRCGTEENLKYLRASGGTMSSEYADCLKKMELVNELDRLYAEGKEADTLLLRYYTRLDEINHN